jgi:HSP20 family protein
MALTDLIQRGRNRPAPASYFNEAGDPFLALSRNMNRLLDDFTRGFGVSMPGRFGPSEAWPHVEVRESDKDVTVVAELPGMDEKDIEVSLHDGLLTLKGEKKSESTSPVYTERWHGQFQRSLQVGPDVNPEQIGASFKNGVLTVTMAKRTDAQQQVKRIPITSA